MVTDCDDENDDESDDESDDERWSKMMQNDLPRFLLNLDALHIFQVTLMI